MDRANDPKIIGQEPLVQKIIRLLGYSFYTGADSCPISVLTWFDKHDFSADQWRRIEERLIVLLRRVTAQRKQTEEYERRISR